MLFSHKWLSKYSLLFSNLLCSSFQKYCSTISIYLTFCWRCPVILNWNYRKLNILLFQLEPLQIKHTFLLSSNFLLLCKVLWTPCISHKICNNKLLSFILKYFSFFFLLYAKVFSSHFFVHTTHCSSLYFTLLHFASYPLFSPNPSTVQMFPCF